MHHMDANKMRTEKARWEVHNNATNYIEQILVTTPPWNNSYMDTNLPSLKPSK